MNKVLTKLELNKFIEEVGSSSPAPGGGSVSALCGALSNALNLMVCNLTVNKKQVEPNKAELEKIINRTKARINNLTRLIDEDTNAFIKVMAAYKLPKASEEEKLYRKGQIEKAILSATDVPFQTCKECFEALKDAIKLLDICNKNCISDVGVAVKLALAGLEGASLNVKINLPGLNTDLLKKYKTETETILNEAYKLNQMANVKLKEALN